MRYAGIVIDPELLERAADEVDRTLLEWFRGLTVAERLKSASDTAAQLERMARAASTDR
jgi:hypothetical protein